MGKISNLSIGTRAPPPLSALLSPTHVSFFCGRYFSRRAMNRVLVTSMDHETRPFCTARSASLELLCPWDKTVLARTSSEAEFEWNEELHVPTHAWEAGCLVRISDNEAPQSLREVIFEGRVDPSAAHQRICGVTIALLRCSDDTGGQHNHAGAKEALLRLKLHALHRRYCKSSIQNERDLHRSAECIQILTQELNECALELNECNKKLKRLTGSRLLVFGKYVLW